MRRIAATHEVAGVGATLLLLSLSAYRAQFTMHKYRGPLSTSSKGAKVGDSRQTAKGNLACDDRGVEHFGAAVNAFANNLARHERGHSRAGEGVDASVSSSPGAGKEAARAESPVEGTGMQVRVLDKHAMPAPVQQLQSMSEAIASFPDALRQHFVQYCEAQQISSLSLLQRTAIPLLAEARDAILVAPTGTGKTLAFLLPLLSQLLAEVTPGMSVAESRLTVLNLELQKKISNGQVCKLCEMEVSKVPVCPVTGKLHPPGRSNTELALDGQRRGSGHATKLKEVTSVTAPKLLVLSPTNELTRQSFKVGRKLHCGLKIGHLVRAADLDEKRAILKSFEGSDVLFATPEQAVVALYKKKLSLQQLHAVVFDEMDELLSRVFFDPIKVLLGAMPKGARRPQRVFVGATFPKAIRDVVTQSLTLPSHRLVIVKRVEGVPSDSPSRCADQAGAAVAVTASSKAARSPFSSSFTDIAALASGNMTHTVFMLSHMEKIEKLLWLFTGEVIHKNERTIIFCKSRTTAQFVYDRVTTALHDALGIRVIMMTRGSTVTAQDAARGMLQRGSATVVVTTDVSARGIDFRDVVNCVHFDAPIDIETWAHRNGRCGRRGAPGDTYTFFQPEDVRLARPLVSILRETRQPVPSQLQQYASMSFVDLLSKSSLHSPLRTKRRSSQEHHIPVVNPLSKYPDFKQEKLNQHFKPMS